MLYIRGSIANTARGYVPCWSNCICTVAVNSVRLTEKSTAAVYCETRSIKVIDKLGEVDWTDGKKWR